MRHVDAAQTTARTFWLRPHVAVQAPGCPVLGGVVVGGAVVGGAVVGGAVVGGAVVGGAVVGGAVVGGAVVGGVVEANWVKKLHTTSLVQVRHPSQVQLSIGPGS